MSEFPHPHVIFPTSRHTHTIILLHGRSSNGLEFAEEVFEGHTSIGLSLQEHLPGWKWVFPSSQTRYSTLFQEEMDEWFDIYSLTNPTLREELQFEGLQQSVAFIHHLIQDEAAHVPLANIVLGGISQGCATAVRAMLDGHGLGAFVGFCSWMPFPSNVQNLHASISSSQQAFDMSTLAETTQDMNNRPQEEQTLNAKKRSGLQSPGDLQSNKLFIHNMTMSDHGLSSNTATNTPVFLSHAKDDEVVDFDLGFQLRNILQQQLGMKVTWREYDDGGHWIKEPEGFDDVLDFLKATFGSVCFR